LKSSTGRELQIISFNSGYSYYRSGKIQGIVYGAFSSRLTFGEAVGVSKYFAYTYLMSMDGYPTIKKICLLHPETLIKITDFKERLIASDYQRDTSKSFHYSTYDPETEEWTQWLYDGKTGTSTC